MNVERDPDLVELLFTIVMKTYVYCCELALLSAQAALKVIGYFHIPWMLDLTSRGGLNFNEFHIITSLSSLYEILITGLTECLTLRGLRWIFIFSILFGLILAFILAAFFSIVGMFLIIQMVLKICVQW